MNSYNKQALDIIAKEQGFIRDNLEKVMRLVETLNYFHDSPLLSKSLVLKGGTAINLTVFQLPRLSVDIDLDFTVDCDRDRRSEHFDFEKAKTEVKDFLSKLLVLTESEKEYVREFNDKKYIPELLFEDKEMVNRIKFHPMALWKTRSRRMFFCKF